MARLDLHIKAKIQKLGTSARQSFADDWVFAWSITIGLALLLSGATLAAFAGLARELLIGKLLGPLAALLFSDDGIVTEKGLDFLDAHLNQAIVGGVLLATGLLVYGWLWRYFSIRLASSPKTELTKLPIRPIEWLLLFGILGGATALRLQRMTDGLDYDEIFTSMNFVGAKSLWETVSTYLVFNNHIAYSVLARFSEIMLGRSEWALRLPALLLGIAGIFVTWHGGRRRFGIVTGLLAALLLALSPLHVELSQSARGYTGALLFGLLSTFAFLEGLQHPCKRQALVYVTTTCLAIYFHLYGVLLVLVQALFLLWVAWQSAGTAQTNPQLGRKAFRFAWISLAATAIGCSILYAPVSGQLFFNVAKRGRGTFSPAFPLTVLHEFAGDAHWLLATAVLLLAGLGIAKHAPDKIGERLFWIVLLTLPIAAGWFARPLDLYVRFFAFLLPVFLLFVAKGFANFAAHAWTIGWVPGKYLASALLVAGGLLVAASWQVNAAKLPPKPYTYRELSNALTRSSDSTVGLCAIGTGCEVFGYYAQQTLWSPATLQEFVDFAARHKEIRCAYNRTKWDSREHQEIARFLEQHAQTDTPGGTPVYRYVNPSNSTHAP